MHVGKKASSSARAIGPAGTTARVLLGLLLLYPAVLGRFQWREWLLGAKSQVVMVWLLQEKVQMLLPLYYGTQHLAPTVIK